MPLPVYIPCHEKDLPVLPFCVKGLREHPEVGAVTVVAAAGLREPAEDLGVLFLQEEEVLRRPDLPLGDRSGWYYQMLLKLELARRDDVASRYMTIDADTVLLGPMRLLDEDGAALHPRMSERHDEYAVGIEHLLGRPPRYEGSYIAHFMVWEREHVEGMFRRFAEVAGRPEEEGRQVLADYVLTCDANRWFSEFETYGHFVRGVAPGSMRWVERRQLNVLHVAPSPSVLRRLSLHYDYCSFHAYRQSPRRVLRAAGRAWLTQRLVRDRLLSTSGAGR